MKVLFLYAGSRKKKYEDYIKGVGPDTELLGLNYMKERGIEADFLENKWTDLFRRISFQLTQLPAIFYIRQYDIVFSVSGLILLFFIKRVLRRKRPLWIIYNTNLCRLLKKYKVGLLGFFIRRAVRSADAIVSLASPQKVFLEKEEGVSAEKNYFIPCGVDMDYFINRPAGPRVVRGRYILSMGRDPGRDYVTLLRAVENTNTPTIIGALKRNFPAGITFPQNVRADYFQKEKVPVLLHDAEFVVVPVFDEKRMIGADFCGQYSILEAMAAGKAIITSTFSDAIIPEVNGIIVPPEDPEALQKAIVRLWNNPDEAIRMGKAGKKIFADGFTSREFGVRLAEVFLEVANRSH